MDINYLHCLKVMKDRGITTRRGSIQKQHSKEINVRAISILPGSAAPPSDFDNDVLPPPPMPPLPHQDYDYPGMPENFSDAEKEFTFDFM